jgi:hypothetical protein
LLFLGIGQAYHPEPGRAFSVTPLDQFPRIYAVPSPLDTRVSL